MSSDPTNGTYRTKCVNKNKAQLKKILKAEYAMNFKMIQNHEEAVLFCF